MRIFFDTNVLVSGFVSRGLSFDVIKDVVYRHEVYCSEAILKEARRVLSTKFPLSDEAVRLAMDTLDKHFIRGVTAESLENVAPDPADNQILADALVNECDLLVTGDKELLALKRHHRLRIISPAEYWKL